MRRTGGSGAAGQPPARGSRSLVLRIVLTFLVLSTLMVGLVAAVAYARARSALHDSERSRLASVQALTVDALQRWLDEQRRSVIFASGLLGGVERQGTLPEVRGSVALLLDPGSPEAARTRAGQVVRRTLKYAVEQSSDAQELMVLDPGGSVLVSTETTHEGVDLSAEPFVAESASSTRVHPLAETGLGGAPTVVVTTPLYDDSGRARGTVAATLDIGRLDQVVLARTGAGAGARTYLVDGDRRVFSRGTDEPVSSLAVDRGLEGLDGNASYDDYTGTPVIGSWTWVPTIGAVLVSEVPQSTAYSPARSLARTIALIGAAVVAGLAALIFVAARRIAGPVLAITEAAEAVTAGDLERVAPVTTRDEVGSLAVAFNDMTEQLRRDVAELEQRVEDRTRELSMQKRYFEALVEISPAAVVTMDTELRVTGWNPAAERLFGYTVAEARGRFVDDLVLTSDAMREEGQDLAEQAFEHSRADRVTQRARKDGTLVDVEIVMVPLVVDGEQVGSYAVYHDVTALHEARLEADRANAAKSAFVAAMSHEIRTPLNAIIGLGKLLHESDLTPEQADFAGSIAASGEGLLAVINDVLDLSKIEAGRMELDLGEVDPADEVEKAVELLGAAADWRTDLVLDIASDVPARVVADRVRLRQIVLNLVGNAIKFADGGRVVVAVRSSIERSGAPEGPKARVTVSVTDNGLGIPREQQVRLFQSFVQASGQTQRRYGGTGLGLAISRSLAELMGGELHLESPVADGRGSRFVLEVPVQVVSTATEPPGRAMVEVLAGRRVAVVHHDPVAADVLAQRLREVEAEVLTGNGLAALPWSDVAVALLDPGLEGVAQAVAAGAPPAVVLVSRIPRWRAPELLGWTPPESVPWLTEPVRARSLVRSVLDALSPGSRASVAPVDGAAPMPRLSGLRVLVAEDNAVNQKLVRALLDRIGIVPDIVGDGASAVEAVRSQAYDVALLDLRMPVMDGLEAARTIASGKKAGDHVPVLVALTADVGEQDRRAAREAGMTEFLAKPLRAEELHAVLTRVPRQASGVVAAPASLDRLRALAGGDAELARELTAAFVEGVPELVAELDAAVAHSSAGDLRRVAHTLKSHGALLGVEILTQRGREVESLLDDGRFDDACVAAEALHATAVDAAAQLREVVA